MYAICPKARKAVANNDRAGDQEVFTLEGVCRRRSTRGRLDAPRSKRIFLQLSPGVSIAKVPRPALVLCQVGAIFAVRLNELEAANGYNSAIEAGTVNPEEREAEMLQRIRIGVWRPVTTAGALTLSAALLLWNSVAMCQDQERPQTEREVAQRQLEVMRLALPALREAEMEKAVELMQDAIRAREVTLEGRRDDEAHQIRERSPSRATQAEVLALTARLWKEFGNEDKAELVGELARSLATRERQRRDRERPEHEGRERPLTEREHAQRQLEVMKLGLDALREAEKEDAAELLHRAIRAREVTLEGRRDDEAHQIRERSPKPGAQAEVLGLAARIWKEFGRSERAQAVRELSEQLAARDHRDGKRREDAERREREVDLPREVWKAIDQLREHGHGEIAGALQRRVMDLLREARGRGERDESQGRGRDPAEREIRRRELRHEGEQRRERESRRDPDLQRAVHRLRAELNEIRKRPPVHPEVSHVLRDLSAEVKRLRAELNELRADFRER